MFKSKFLLLGIATISMLCAGDKVSIGAYGDYPTADCVIGGKHYLIPNNTEGEIVKWNSIYTEGRNEKIFARVDMLSESEVKLLTGPQKGKTCSIGHIYLKMK